jgi:hypothetical protein
VQVAQESGLDGSLIPDREEDGDRRASKNTVGNLECGAFTQSGSNHNDRVRLINTLQTILPKILPGVPNPDWRLLEELFQAAYDLTATERTAFLDRACGSDASIRAEVESLLASADQTAGFIQQPVLDAARNVSSSFPFRGKRIGPYELCA